LVDGDLVLTESVAIVLYLAEKYPEKGLLPADLTGRAQVNAGSSSRQPSSSSRSGGSHGTPALYRRQAPAGRRGARRQEFKEMAAVLEKHLQGRQFVVGERATVADFVTAYTLDWGGEARLLTSFPCCGNTWSGCTRGRRRRSGLRRRSRAFGREETPSPVRVRGKSLRREVGFDCNYSHLVPRLDSLWATALQLHL